jgi:hypothetical protein
MPYGTIKVDNITFTDNSVDKTVSLSGLIQNPTFTGNVTVTGTISGDVIRGGTTISGVTVTGTTANFVSGVFTTQVSGTTIIATTGNFTSLTGTTTTGTTANFVSGVFTTQLSGVTVTGTTANFTSGNFTSLNGTTTTVTSGVFSAGSATAPSVAVGTGTTYKPGIYSPGTDQLAISTNGTGRLFVTNNGVGTGAAPQSGYGGIQVRNSFIYINEDGADTVQMYLRTQSSEPAIQVATNHPFKIQTNNAERMRLRADGTFEIKGAGTAGVSPAVSVNPSAPTNSLFISSGGLVGLGISTPSSDGPLTLANGSETPTVFFSRPSGGSFSAAIQASSFGTLTFYNGAESSTVAGLTSRMTINGQTGNVGIGFTGPEAALHAGGNSTSPIILAGADSIGLDITYKFRQSRGTITSPGDTGGEGVRLSFEKRSSSAWASPIAEIYAAGGGSGADGYLEFLTKPSGGSATPRARIDSSGRLLVGTSNDTDSEAGTRIKPGALGGIYVTNNTSDGGARVLLLNRQGGDGNLIDFRESNTLEGAISVSGTTVTYGGGHLARWSQLPNDEGPSGILKGTIMSNLDEMCEWGEEDNEQLNKTKVSDVEGDPNVAGVFVSTSFSDDGPLDYFCAMTGDMIIRIAEGVTVQRGDLLMSAGDGTAKPQDDDIIRSKTIAKVTSTNVSCTYEDGSYCVPCVLMAC